MEMLNVRLWSYAKGLKNNGENNSCMGGDKRLEMD